MDLSTITTTKPSPPVRITPEENSVKPPLSDETQLLTKIVPSALQALMTDTKAVGSTSIGKVLSAETLSLGGLLGIAGKGFGIFGGLSGAFDLILNWGKSTPVQGAASGAAAGAAAGSFIPGVGTAIGGALGGLLGGVAGTATSGKHHDQKARDGVRAALVEAGFLTSQYQLPLANGMQYDMGIDGGPKAELDGRRPFEVNFTDPMAAQTVAWLNPITSLIFDENEKLRSDFTGYLTNAALTGAKSLEEVKQNVKGIMERLNISPQQLLQWEEFGLAAGAISKEEWAIHTANVRSLID